MQACFPGESDFIMVLQKVVRTLEAFFLGNLILLRLAQLEHWKLASLGNLIYLS